MSEAADTVERVLRDELVEGDRTIAAARPILRHLLASDDTGLFSDETIAHVRGLVLSVAEQLLFAQAAAAEARDRAAYVIARQDYLAHALCTDAAFLGHAHALTVEAQLTERLQEKSGIDAVLTPVVEELIASGDGEVAGLAMAVLAAQARFQQHWRRMELPLRELPGELFHRVLTVLREQARGDDASAAEGAERGLRDGYREGEGRLGLITQLVMGLGHWAPRTLAIEPAGLAIFASALALASGQERDRVVLSFSERQCTRLALALRAAGLAQPALLEQAFHLCPDVALPEGFESLRADRAVALLASSEARS
jgi:hypothetical protein